MHPRRGAGDFQANCDRLDSQTLPIGRQQQRATAGSWTVPAGTSLALEIGASARRAEACGTVESPRFVGRSPFRQPGLLEFGDSRRPENVQAAILRSRAVRMQEDPHCASKIKPGAGQASRHTPIRFNRPPRLLTPGSLDSHIPQEYPGRSPGPTYSLRFAGGCGGAGQCMPSSFRSVQAWIAVSEPE